MLVIPMAVEFPENTSSGRYQIMIYIFKKACNRYTYTYVHVRSCSRAPRLRNRYENRFRDNVSRIIRIVYRDLNR